MSFSWGWDPHGANPQSSPIAYHLATALDSRPPAVGTSNGPWTSTHQPLLLIRLVVLTPPP